eukprot:706273-Prymnesium_polylepis.2
MPEKYVKLNDAQARSQKDYARPVRPTFAHNISAASQFTPLKPSNVTWNRSKQEKRFGSHTPCVCRSALITTVRVSRRQIKRDVVCIVRERSRRAAAVAAALRRGVLRPRRGGSVVNRRSTRPVL